MSDINLSAAKAVDSAAKALTAEVPSGPVVSGLSVFANVSTAFIFVICFILIIAWFVKRSGVKKFACGLINVRGSYPITAKDRIIVVEVDNKLLVIGITPQQMTLLHTIDEKATTALRCSESAENKTRSINGIFSQLLQSALKRGK